MSNNKGNPSTRDVVETVIDLTKEDRTISWERMAEREREQNCRYEEEQQRKGAPAKFSRKAKREECEKAAS